MYQQDYILRLIQTVGQMLLAMLHATREQRPEDALKIASDAVEAILETDASLADALTGEGLVTFLSAGGELDVVRARLLAEILAGRAEALDQDGRAGSAEHERSRALAVLDAAAHDADGSEAERIAELTADLRKRQTLP